MERKDLVKAAEELNEVLGLDPEIEVDNDIEALKTLISEAAELIEPEDEISKRTTKVIKQLEGQEEVPVTEDKGGKMMAQQKQEPEPPKKAGKESKKESTAKKASGGVISGKLEGRQKQKTLTEAIDKIIAKGGTWDEVMGEVEKEVEKFEKDPKKYNKGTIREHIRSRLSRGWLNADFEGKITITVTEEGIEVEEV